MAVPDHDTKWFSLLLRLFSTSFFTIALFLFFSISSCIVFVDKCFSKLLL
jgi:hypothetical protein